MPTTASVVSAGTSYLGEGGKYGMMRMVVVGSVSVSPVTLVIVGVAFYGVLRYIYRWWYSWVKVIDPLTGQITYDIPPRGHYDSLPFGLDGLYNLISSYRAHTICQDLHMLFQSYYQVDTFRMRQLGQDQLVTRDHRIIQAVLTTQFKDFGLASDRKGMVDLLGVNGIFTQDGDEWAHSRSLLRPSFARREVEDVGQLEWLARQLVSVVDGMSKGVTGRCDDDGGNEDGVQADLFPALARVTLDSSTLFLTGESVGSLGALLDRKSGGGEGELRNMPSTKGSIIKVEGEQFMSDFDYSQEITGLKNVLCDMHWLVNPFNFKQACTRIHSWTDRFVAQALQSRNSNPYAAISTSPLPGEKDPSPSATGGKYIFLESLTSETQSPKILRDQLLNVLLAGRDTTAALLAFTILSLSRHPDVLFKLRQEIASLVGVNQYDPATGQLLAGSPPPRLPTKSDILEMKYLRYVLNESLRLYPPVPVNSRRALVDTTLPFGGGPDASKPVKVKAGYRVSYCVYSLHRSPDMYGPDPEEFRPERWVEEKYRRVGWRYLPFNGGPRICLGQQMALIQASYFIIRLLQEFSRIEYTGKETERDMKLEVGLVMKPAEGVRVRMSRV